MRSGTQELRLALDTGADRTVFYGTTWKRLSDESIEEAPLARIMTVTGETTERRVRLKDLRLGSLRVTDVPVNVSDAAPRPLRNGAAVAASDGLLGMDVLARYLVVIDGPGRILYLAERAAGE